MILKPLPSHFEHSFFSGNSTSPWVDLSYPWKSELFQCLNFSSMRNSLPHCMIPPCTLLWYPMPPVKLPNLPTATKTKRKAWLVCFWHGLLVFPPQGLNIPPGSASLMAETIGKEKHKNYLFPKPALQSKACVDISKPFWASLNKYVFYWVCMWKTAQDLW